MARAARIGWSLLALAALAMPARADGPRPAIDAFQAAFFDDATFTLHARSYLFDEEETTGGDPAAWALGGWFGYRTGWIGDVLQLGAVEYTSQPLWAPGSRAGSELLLPDQDGFSVLGQAYAALRYEGQTLTLYRQLVDQPEINPHDTRMVPNTFEGGTLTGGLGPVTYFAGILTGMKTRDSDSFVSMSDIAGVSKNEIMYTGTLAVAPVDGVKLRSSAYAVPDVLVSSYSDGDWTLDITPDVSLTLAGQFMIQGGIGAELLTGPGFRPWVAGALGTLDVSGFRLLAGYTSNGTDDGWKAPYGAWPGYSHMQVKDFDRAGEQALVLGAGLDGSDWGLTGLALSAKCAIDTEVEAGEPRWREYDVSAIYNLAGWEEAPGWLSPLQFEAHYGYVDIHNSNGSRDRIDQLQLILNYEIQFTGAQFRS